MSDTKHLPSDNELERQIATLADAAFAETQPVTAPSTSLRRGGHGWGDRVALVAAVVLVALAVGGFAWLFGRPAMNADPVGDTDQRRTVADDGTGESESDGEEDSIQPPPDAVPGSEVLIEDPLNIDLDELADASDQSRLQDLNRAVRTVEFADLPPGWELQREEVELSYHFSGQPSIIHYINVNGPGPLRAVVSVDAAWEPGVVRSQPLAGDGSAKQLNLGETTAYYELNQLSWTVDDRLVVDLFVDAESSVANTEPELVELVELLTVVERPLRLSESAVEFGDVLDVAEPLLAGRLSGNEWVIVSEDDQLRVGFRPDDETPWTEIRSELASTTIAGESEGEAADREVQIFTATLPDGVLWFGTTTQAVETMTVRLDDGRAIIPIVPLGSGSSFALPIDHRLDVVEALLIDEQGNVAIREDVASLPVDVEFADS